MTDFKLGVAKHTITPKNIEIQLQGFADPTQKSDGICHEIFSRTFVIQSNSEPEKKIAISIAEVWACTKYLKSHVLDILIKKHQLHDFNEANLHIAGTHTHGAPAGYVGHKLYSQPLKMGNRAQHDKIARVANIIAHGIARSIYKANKNLKNGRLYKLDGKVEGCGKQRSKEAYENNPTSEKKRYKTDTDKDMLLLKFTHVTPRTEKVIGILNWYAIHPNSLGQFIKKISGDNKGEASSLFEKDMKDNEGKNNFVAAFANSNCGDVSGNVDTDMTDKVITKPYIDNMRAYGNLQFQEAKRLTKLPGVEIKGSINYWFRMVNMSNIRIKKSQKRTWPFALGISFAAGSEQDGVSVYELFGKINTIDKKQTTEGLIVNKLRKSHKDFLDDMKAGMRLGLSTTKVSSLSDKEVAGHHPKPIGFTGKNREEVVPGHLPLQAFQIGDFALLSIPAELSTMAGRRLKKKVLKNFSKKGIKDLALGTYANDYSQYITTPEEYKMQYYEGASTPFGPYTLHAYIQEFKALTLPEDQFIDCINDSKHHVKFEIEYVDFAGKSLKLNYRREEEYYRFCIPYNATSAKIRARVKKSSTWVDKKWHILKLKGSRTSQSVTYNRKSLKYKGTVEKKVIECINASTSRSPLLFRCSYTSVRGKSRILFSDRNRPYYHKFILPWNAKDINVVVCKNKTTVISNEQSILINSHQKVNLIYLQGLLKSRGVVSQW